MGKWSTILNAGKYMINNPLTRSAGKTIVSPVRSLRSTGEAVKNATIGAGVGYVGWQALVNDKPVVRTVADITIGENNVNKMVDSTSEIADSAKQAIGSVGNSASSVTGVFSGISDFIKNLSSGNGTNMFGNLLNNMLKGNVSGLSIVGLLAAGLMIFSRTGFLGKIAGAMLAMMLIGQNSRQVLDTPTIDNQQTSTFKR